MKKLLPLLIICLVLLPSISLADTDTTNSPLKMEELSIKVLPEFAYHPSDQKKAHPPLLIGYQGILVNSQDQSIQGTIEIPLPMNEKNFRIGYVADYYSSDLSKAHEIEYNINRNKRTISWTTSEKIEPQGRYKFIIEYYTDGIEVNKDERKLAYKFQSFADIGLVDLVITQPYKATNVKLTPSPKQINHDEGNDTSTYIFQNVKAGDEKNVTLSYKRKETKPFVELVNEKGAGKNYVVEIASFSGIGLLAAGSITVFLRKRKRD